VDRPKLTEINRRSDAVLPTTDQLNDELRNAMNTVTETMKKIEEEQAVEHDKLKTLGKSSTSNQSSMASSDLFRCCT
jgi:DNA-binding transcriptional regulator YhcF (GntR family)